MTTAHHLRLIDGMRTREFPAERVRSGSGVSGPGYHVVYLHPPDEVWEDDEAARLERRAQCVADHEALVTLLTSRWGGGPEPVSLFSARERMVSGGRRYPRRGRTPSRGGASTCSSGTSRSAG